MCVCDHLCPFLFTYHTPEWVWLRDAWTDRDGVPGAPSSFLLLPARKDPRHFLDVLSAPDASERAAGTARGPAPSPMTRSKARHSQLPNSNAMLEKPTLV